MLFSPDCPAAGPSGCPVPSLREHDESLRLVRPSSSAHVAWVATLAGPLVAVLPVRSIGAATAAADSQKRRVGPRVALPPGSGPEPLCELPETLKGALAALAGACAPALDRLSV